MIFGLLPAFTPRRPRQHTLSQIASFAGPNIGQYAPLATLSHRQIDISDAIRARLATVIIILI